MALPSQNHLRARWHQAFCWMTLCVLLANCTKRASDVSTVTLPQTLTLSGRIQTPQGGPVPNALLAVESLEGVRAQSNGDGSFSLPLSAEELATIAAKTPNAFFRVFATNPSQILPRLSGLSATIDARERGSKTLAPIVLDRAASLAGMVLAQRQGQRPEPLENARLKMGRFEILSSKDGSFSFAEIPAGSDILTISYGGFETAFLPLTFAAGETKVLQDPIFLFPGNAVAGFVQMLPAENIDDLVASGRPYLRSLRVFASPRAHSIRYSADPDQFKVDPAASKDWKNVSEVMDYDFPGGGGSTLFVQFADATRTNFSETYQITVVIDLFSSSKGITIEDGSGIVRRRNVAVNIDVPSAAYLMRIAESNDALSNAKWQAPRPVAEFVFPLVLDTTNGEITANGLRQVFVQFMDAHRLESQIFHTSVYLEIFSRENDAFKVNEGAPISPFRTVKIDIKVPPGARNMRIYDIDRNLSSGGFSGSGGIDPTVGTTWLEPAPQMFYTFTSTGMKTVYLQFRDADRALSPAYIQTIRIDPEQNSGANFMILSGDYSLSKQIQFQLNFPPHVRDYRVFEFDVPRLEEWRQIEPVGTYNCLGFGPRTIHVQYRTIDGDVMGSMTQNVFVDPFPPGSFGFTFDPAGVEILSNPAFGANLLTRSPVVRLLIQPPPGARSVAIVAEAADGNFWDTFDGWMPLNIDQAGIPIPTAFDLPLPQSTGLKSVTVRFRSPELITSTKVTQSIYLDPFFVGPTAVRLNDGAETTDTSTVTLSVILGQLPSGFPLSFRYQWDTTADWDELPWEPLELSRLLNLGTTAGSHRIYVQLRLGTIVSTVFSDSIRYEPPSP